MFKCQHKDCLYHKNSCDVQSQHLQSWLGCGCTSQRNGGPLLQTSGNQASQPSPYMATSTQTCWPCISEVSIWCLNVTKYFATYLAANCNTLAKSRQWNKQHIQKWGCLVVNIFDLLSADKSGLHIMVSPIYTMEIPCQSIYPNDILPFHEKKRQEKLYTPLWWRWKIIRGFLVRI